MREASVERDEVAATAAAAEPRAPQTVERTVERLRRMYAVSAELAHALTIERVAEAAVDLGVSALAARMGALFLLEDGALRLFRAAGFSDEERVRFARLPLDRSVAIADCLLSREAIYVESRDEYTRRYPRSIARAGVEALPSSIAVACLPLLVDGAARGVLALVFDDPRSLDRDERGFLELLAGHCAQAVERARLYRANEEARLRAEEAHREMAALYRLAESFAGSGSLAGLCDQALTAICRDLDVDRASILLADDAGVLRFVAWRGLSDDYRRAVAGHTPWTRGERDAQPIYVADVEADETLAAYRPVLRAEGVRALAFVPLVGDGELIGELVLHAREPRDFSERDRRLARAFAEMCAQAIDHARLDEAKRMSERRYRSLLEAMTSVVWTCDAGGEFVTPQDAWRRYTGHPWERHRGAGWADAVHPDDRDRVVALWAAAVERGQPYFATCRLWHAASASYRHVEARAVPIVDAGGAVIEWVGKILDVHDRKVAEAEREEAVRRLGIRARVSEELGRAAHDLGHAFRMVTRLVAENLGDSCNIEVPGDDDGPAIAEGPRADPRLAAGVLASGEAVISAEDGGALVLVPMRVEGRAIGVLGAARHKRAATYTPADVMLLQEIADRAALAVASARSFGRAESLHRRLSAVMDAVPALIAFVDSTERYQLVSRSYESWFGAPRRSFIGRPLREVLGERAYAVIAGHVAAALSGQRVEFEAEMPVRGLATRHVRATYTPIRDTGGAVNGFASLVVDLSDVKRSAGFGELFAGVLAHDLRNPLGAITVAAQLLRRRGTAPELERPVARIVDSAERMSRMIDQLLDVTRIRLGGGLPLRRARVDLGAVCRSVVDEIETGGGGAAIEVELAGDPHGRWDGDRLAQMLGNVIGNAVRHRSGTRPVRVVVDGRARDALEVRVSNDGAIPANALGHIFEPFRRGTTHAERASGLGLGLYITREVVTAHGGRIEVSSTEADGTTFTVHLPRTD